MRRLFRHALFVVFLLVTGATLTEIGARARVDAEKADYILAQALPRLLNSAWLKDPADGVPRLTPSTSTTIHRNGLRHTVTTNSLGFRGREPAPRLGGEYRVLFLGDSMVFGEWLEETETIPAQVEVCAAARGHDVVAYNGAMSGLNTVQELLVARELVPSLAPDQVVLGYFVGNDPLANTLARIDGAGHYVFDEDRARRMGEALAAQLQPWLWSHAFRAVALRYFVPRLRYSWSAADSVLSQSCDLLGRIRDDCLTAGTGFSVVLIYPRDAVGCSLTNRISGSRNVGRQLARHLRDRDIEVLDSADHMAVTDAEDRDYFAHDGHLSPTGAWRLAEAVTAQLIAPRATVALTPPR